jgi:hypothetical protein
MTDDRLQMTVIHPSDQVANVQDTVSHGTC